MTLTTILNANRLTDAGIRIALRRVMAAVRAPRTIKAGAGLRACIADLAHEIHQRIADAGWWTDLKTGEPLNRNVGELLMLTVSEIGEIPPYPQNEAMLDDKLPDRLMIEVELADACIRLFDTIGALAPHAPDAFVASNIVYDVMFGADRGEKQMWHADKALMAVIRKLSDAMESHRKGRVYVNVTGPTAGEMPGFDFHLAEALYLIFHIGLQMGLDVEQAISEKLEFNATRSDHKLENRRKDDGKKY